MNAQYRKNLKDVATACKNYTDKKIDDLKWELGSHTLDVESDTDVAYSKTVPSGTIKCHINKVGCMSYKYNQLFATTDYTLTRYNVTISRVASTHTITITTDGIASNNGDLPLGSIAYTPNHKYLLHYLGNNTGSNIVVQQIMNGTFVRNKNTSAGNNTIFNYTETDANKLSFVVGYVNGGIPSASMQFMIFDLTDMGIDTTDVATATTELLKRGIDINQYNEYNAGDIRDSAVTSVVSKDSNNTTLDTYTIPAEVQALDGYGWGVNDTCYNYIDFETKKFIKKVARVDLGSLSWTSGWTNAWYSDELTDGIATNSVSTVNNNILSANYIPSVDVINGVSGTMNYWSGSGYKRIAICNGSTTTKPSGYLYYELATPVETDISEYIDNGSIVIEADGTLTFTNTYEQAVPSDIDYLIEEVKA